MLTDGKTMIDKRRTLHAAGALLLMTAQRLKQAAGISLAFSGLPLGALGPMAAQATIVLVLLTLPARAAVPDAPADGAAMSESASGMDGRVFCNGVRRHDEIVVVNTRMLGCSCDPESIRTGLNFETYAVIDDVGYRRWQSSDLESFLALDPHVPTLIFVHGNQITPADAKREGIAVYRRLIEYGSDSPPIRFVIMSWPSSRVGGLLRDVRVKATRTDPAGCQLAWLLDQMPAETPISLVGFSYGARIITAGLHILAGGQLGHLHLAEHVHPQRPAVNVVLMSAALHAHWLGEGQYHGLAMTQINQLFLLNNCSDPAMRYYHLAFRGGRPQALGLRGPTRMSSDMRMRIHMRDVSRYGSQHNLFLYLCAPGVSAQIWEYTIGGTIESNGAEPVPLQAAL
jgi:hypothetical protein